VIDAVGAFEQRQEDLAVGMLAEAVAIWRSSCLICALSVLIAATSASTSWRRGGELLLADATLGRALRSFASSCAGCWRPE
jgi:hypothetical protein